MSDTICLENTSPMKTKEVNIDIDVLMHQAAKKIVPVWPLKTFIACNPLQGFEDESFEKAMEKAFAISQRNYSSEQEMVVNREMIKWLSSFLDTGQASIHAPNRDKGFYAYFCCLSPYDKYLHQGRFDSKTYLKSLPQSPQEAILFCLKSFQIPFDSYVDFLEQNLVYLPGWSGYVKWLSLWDHTHAFTNHYPIDLTAYMAVRLIITYLLWPQISLEKISLLAQPKMLHQLKQHERVYANNLLKAISENLHHDFLEKPKANVQMVFCIDVRSEPFRRQLESLGSYETIGFAGFFGLPVRIYDEDHLHFDDCCPVLLKPRFSIYQELYTSIKQKYVRKRRQSLLRSFLNAYQQLKYNYATPFQLADAMGPWSGLWMVLKNFFPKQLSVFLSKILEKWIPSENLQLEISGISEKEQIEYAEVILKLMGLTQDFGKLVVFCGHRSTSTNNPYASALDCGACGGNKGENNPKILAQILNQPNVRQQLKQKGINIPVETYFISAVHDTTTDECQLSMGASVGHAYLIDQLKVDLEIARQNNLIYRSQHFDTSSKDFSKKSLNWAEVRPEWGLARNASFIVGPRALTQSVDCDGRCFLHSYDWQIDETGQLLETILTAPMVVAQWINHQYLFSTLDNIAYGSGSKITHNVVGKIGVMQGNASDLMHGLALQSVFQADNKPFHQPMRLLTIVFAPRQRVMDIILKNAVLQKLFFNEWVHLVVIEPQEQCFYRLEHQNWKKIIGA